MSEQFEIDLFTMIGGGLSILGCSFVLFTYYKIPSLRINPIYNNVIFLIFADLFIASYSFGPLIIPVEDNDIGCSIMAMAMQTGRLGSLFWTALFSTRLRQMIYSEQKMNHHRGTIVLFCIIVPLILAYVPLPFGWYGASGVLCWFRQDLPSYEQITLAFSFYYGPFLIVLGYNIWTTFQAIGLLRKKFGEFEDFYQLLLYPFGLFLCNSFGLANRMVIALTDQNIEWLKITSQFFLEMHGFIDALIYCGNYHVRREIRDFYSMKKKVTLDSSETLKVSSNDSLVEGDTISMQPSPRATLVKRESVNPATFSVKLNYQLDS